MKYIFLYKPSRFQIGGRCLNIMIISIQSAFHTVRTRNKKKTEQKNTYGIMLGLNQPMPIGSGVQYIGSQITQVDKRRTPRKTNGERNTL